MDDDAPLRVVADKSIAGLIACAPHWAARDLQRHQNDSEHLVVWEGTHLIHRFPTCDWQVARFVIELKTLSVLQHLRKEGCTLASTPQIVQIHSEPFGAAYHVFAGEIAARASRAG